MDHYYYKYQDSPIGVLVIEEKQGKISGLSMQARWQETGGRYRKTPLLARACCQLQEYFQGKRYSFDLPLYLEGTDFQKKIWAALQTIPYGETRSYGELAEQIGNPRAARAVGGANHHNPVMIVVPCHRVIGADGSLTGFGGGLPAKRYLLGLEKRWAGRFPC